MSQNSDKELDQLFEEIQRLSSNQKEFAHHLSEELEIKGFSQSTISNIRNKPDDFPPSKLRKLKKYLSHYIDFLEENQASNPSKRVNPKLSLFFNRQFFLYFHNDSPVSKEPQIGKAILKIGNNEKEVRIENAHYEGIKATDYSGKVILHQNGRHLKFEMYTSKTQEKGLQMKVHIGPDKVPEIALGVYMNISDSQDLVAGTVILERIDTNDQTISSHIIFPNKDVHHNLHEAIKDYLIDKRLNFIKAKQGIYTKNDLAAFIKKKRKEHPFMIQRPRGHNIFISAPMSSLTEQDFKEFRKDVSGLIDFLRNEYKCEVFWAGMNTDEPQKFPSPNAALYENFSKVKESDKFVLIYPEKTVSSTLVELGWAMVLKMKMIIFCKTRSDLPYILKDSHSNIKIIEYLNSSDLTEKVRNDYAAGSLFPG